MLSQFSNIVLTCLIIFDSAIAAPKFAADLYTIKERHKVPPGWKEIGAVPDSHSINLHVGLTQNNQADIERHVLEASNPSHPGYGQYLSAGEIQNLITPADETVRMVSTWLTEHGIIAARLSPSKDWITASVPVRQVESLLNTTYSVYQHQDGSTLIRAPEWSLPQHLHDHIDLIQPTSSFFRASKLTSDAMPERGPIEWQKSLSKDWWKAPKNHTFSTCDVSSLCNVTGTNLEGDIVTATSLDCLRCLYGTFSYVPKVPDLNMIGVTNYLNETQARSDLRLYLEKFRPEAAGVAETFQDVKIAGAQDNQVLNAEQVEAGLNQEGDLDGELAIGISWPTSFMSWSTGGSPPFIPDLATPTDTNEPYLDWLTYVLAQDTLPQVISTSYGDDEQTVPNSYAKRVCNGYKQLAARGISVLVSGGDSGVGPNGTCFSNSNVSQPEFLPAFPASCPWVTTVGATASFQPEVAVSRFGSGAGFSNYFPMPEYQMNAVDGYLDKIGDLYAGLYNRSGRGYPDVAAQGNHDIIVWEGNVTTIGGTSASAPTFAAVIALVNDALIAAGKPPLGFLNPWLYGGAFAALTDITEGSSIGCNTSGFPAEAGWDAVTGFGTPVSKVPPTPIRNLLIVVLQNLDKLIAHAFHPYMS
ncbi:tripeptidyl-peptidase 1 precursor, partial [Aureobasidium melanogenum]